jgi:hypothetical protein
MKLFERLFTHSKPSEEECLLRCLKELSDSLQSINSHWANVLANFQKQMTDEIASDGSIQHKYELAREIESLFGGMGSLNDIELPKNCKRLHGELFKAVQDVLRIYWRALGRETHSGQFKLFPIGSLVHLVPGKIRYFERNEHPVIIQVGSTDIWRVVRYEEPDITNMPSYVVQHENTFMTARHESLELFSQ